MRNTWQSLAWKEWHEHKWKFAALFAMLFGVTSLSIVLETGRDRFGLAFGMLLLCGIPMSVFIGLGTAANERSRRTLPFLQSLPAPLWHVAILKLIFGFITILVAIAATVASFSLWMWAFDQLGIRYSSPIETDHGGPLLRTGIWQLDITLFCIPVVGSLFIWAAAAGVNRRDEVGAGVVALAAMVAAWTLTVFIVMGLEASQPRLYMLEAIAYAVAPGSFEIVADNVQLSRYVVIGGIAAAIVHSLLVARYIRRFGHVTDLGTRSPQVARPVSGEWLGPPRSSALAAIVWKQFRESGAIAIAGLMAILAIGTFVYAMDRYAEAFWHVYASVAISMGYGIALVVGIGIALHDSEPRLNTFWRTRPINADLWFCVKFFTGLGIVVLVIYVPLLLVGGSALLVEVDRERQLMLMLPVTQLALFAAAVAATCLVRHAIYAAILSIGALVASTSAVALSCLIAARFGWINSRWNLVAVFEDPNIVLVSAILCFVFGTLTAWLATRYDWGFKSRY